MRWWKLKFNLRSLHCRSSLAPRSLCQGDCHAARALYRARRTDADGTRGEARGKKEFKKWRSQSCEKKSVRPPPLARSSSLFLCTAAATRPSAVVGEFFPQRTNSPTFCCSGVFPSPSRTREEKKSISAATPPPPSLALYPSIGSCYAAVTAAAADRRGRTDGRTERRTRARRTGRGGDIVRASPLKERKRERVNPGKDAKPPPQGHHSERGEHNFCK